MEYPQEYTTEDKEKYDNFYKIKIVDYGGNPNAYDLVIINIACKKAVSNSKGEEYILTAEDNADVKRIWEEYGQYNI